jgi:hypothetical protein
MKIILENTHSGDINMKFYCISVMPYQYLQALPMTMLSHLNSMQPDFTKKLIQESFTHMKTTQNTGNSLIIRGKINSGSFSPPPPLTTMPGKEFAQLLVNGAWFDAC